MSHNPANPGTPAAAPNRRTAMLAAAGLLGTSAVGTALYAFRDRLFSGRSSGYGRLRPAKDETTGLELIQLPAGFRYISFGWTKDPLSDGSPTPSSHDGMAVVRAEGTRYTLIRNQERSGRSTPFGREEQRFDKNGPGGCVALVFDGGAGALVESRVALTGTVQNCAGGATPWGTWLSCEENVGGVGSLDAKDKQPLPYEQEHGWVFEVPPEGVAQPKPIPGMGRFVHEAVCIDPATGYVYLTEDSNPSGLYRFRPHVRDQLAQGGTLEMLLAVDQPDLRRGQPKNAEYRVKWLPIPEPTRAHTPGTTDGKGVFQQGAVQGGSSFARLEGAFWANGRVIVDATSGGDASQGQIWELTPGEDKLRLLFESPHKDVLNMPDNLCVSPQGCVLICEDGDRVGQRIHGLTPSGQLFAFAQNHIQLNGEKNGFKGDQRATEWTGVCFSPDGRWLFANLQSPGITVAITGPWESGPF